MTVSSIRFGRVHVLSSSVNTEYLNKVRSGWALDGDERRKRGMPPQLSYLAEKTGDGALKKEPFDKHWAYSSLPDGRGLVVTDTRSKDLVAYRTFISNFAKSMLQYVKDSGLEEEIAQVAKAQAEQEEALVRINEEFEEIQRTGDDVDDETYDRQTERLQELADEVDRMSSPLAPNSLLEKFLRILRHGSPDEMPSSLDDMSEAFLLTLELSDSESVNYVG